MPQHKTINISSTPVFCSVPDNVLADVKNSGSSTVYYGGASVTSSSYTGSIAAAGTSRLQGGYYFVTASSATSIIDVNTVDQTVPKLTSLTDVNTTSQKTGNTLVYGATAGTWTPKGTVVAEEKLIVEAALGGAGTYTATITVPAKAMILDIIVYAVAVWDDGTSASMIVGDDDDDNGFFDTTNLKATDLTAGQSINFDKQGGLGGAYATAGTSTHITNRYKASARSVTAKVSVGAGDGTAGRTRFVVVWSAAHDDADITVSGVKT